MPAAAVGAAIAGVSAGIAAESVAVGIAMGFVSLAGTMVSQSMSDQPDLGSFDNLTGGGVRANTVSTAERLRVVYGQYLVGGNDVYRESTGEDNKDFWAVQVLSEGPCEGIAQENAQDQIFLDQKLPGEYGGNVSYAFYAGTHDQTVDATLAANAPDWADPLRYTTYVRWKLRYDKDEFLSFPKRQVLLKGRRLYDFRDGTTAWSQNVVLALYDFLTSTRYGLGNVIAPSDLDLTSWISAANYVDARGWKFNYVVEGGESAWDAIDAMCNHFRGQLVYWSGKLHLRYADLRYETSVMTLDSDMLAAGDDGEALIAVSQPDRYAKPKCLRVWYTDQEEWVADSYHVGEEDDGPPEVKLLGYGREASGEIAAYVKERRDLDRQLTATWRGDALALDPFDVVTVDLPEFGIEDQLMRVMRAQISPNGLIETELSYEAEDLYDAVVNLTETNVYRCTLPDPKVPPPSVSGATIAEETYSYRLRTFTRLNIAFTRPDFVWWSHVEVWHSLDNMTWKRLYDVDSGFSVENVQEGETHYFRLKSVSIHGVRHDDAGDVRLQHTVAGHDTEPDSLSLLRVVVNATAVNLFSARLPDTDIELYEFRLGSSWSGAIFLAALRSPNLSLAGVKPGTHTFWANTLGNNGLYGAVPAGASVTLQDPPDGWSVINTQGYDYQAGTHDNTERHYHVSEYYLRCSHTGGNLAGTWTSPVYDRGASARLLAYVAADITVIGEGTTWDDIAPSPTTWTELLASGNRWLDVITIPSGPTVNMRLEFGETTALGSEIGEMEISTAIIEGRYFRVVIEIMDPSPEVFALVSACTLKLCTAA